MGTLRTLDQLDVAGKRVLVRVDFNVPMKNGAVANDARIREAAGTLTELIDKGAGVVVASHMGRPKGQVIADLSLEPLTAVVQSYVPNAKVSLCGATDLAEVRKAAAEVQAGELLMIENLRFYPGEEQNDADFAKHLAGLADVYLDDAFSCAHRAHASVEGVANLLPSAAGRLMEKEINALIGALESPARPAAAIIGGSKISTKLSVLENLTAKVDYLVIGGAMANTFLFADGYPVGTSLVEDDMISTVADVRARAGKSGCEIILPTDVVMAPEFKEGAPAMTTAIDAVPDAMMILDVGPVSIARLGGILDTCKTVLWNGPLGAFEIQPFDAGTIGAAQKVAHLTQERGLLSVAGGGDTVAALEAAGVAEQFSYVSMAGGAFLEWLEGRELPGVAVLQD